MKATTSGMKTRTLILLISAPLWAPPWGSPGMIGNPGYFIQGLGVLIVLTILILNAYYLWRDTHPKP